MISNPTQAAACGKWTAAYNVSLSSGHESERLHHTWSSVSNCDTFTFHHYLACWRDGVAGSSLTAPTSPTGSGVTCKTLSTTRTATSADLWVYRSYRKFALTIFACQSSLGCSAWYGDGTHGSTVESDTVPGITTQRERWLLVDVADYNDNSRVAGSTASMNGPEAIFYPDGFADEG